MPFKSLLIIFLSIFILSTPSTAKSKIVIDDFEDGDITSSPNWYTFGNIRSVVQGADKEGLKYIGEKALVLSGQTDVWYIGGLGLPLSIDATPYKFIKMLVKGNGPGTGQMIIELFDDDNNNRQLERHPRVSSQTLYDDKFIYTFDINWAGWKVVIIPINKFRDDNPLTGDNTWNPEKMDQSGGLLQMQLIALSSQRKGQTRFEIDSIKLY